MLTVGVSLAFHPIVPRPCAAYVARGKILLERKQYQPAINDFSMAIKLQADYLAGPFPFSSHFLGSAAGGC